MTNFSIEDQIKEVEREIEMRVHVYKGQIARGKMTEQQAHRKTDCMRAVLATLCRVSNTPLVKARDGIGDR